MHLIRFAAHSSIMGTATVVISTLALALSLATFLVSRRDVRRSVRAAEDSASAAKRSADAAERQLALSAPPAVEFVIEQLSKTQYVLRNVGHSTAHAVTVEDFPGLTGTRPVGVALDPGQATSFLIMQALGVIVPTEVVVRCAELPAGVHVPIPCRHSHP